MRREHCHSNDLDQDVVQGVSAGSDSETAQDKHDGKERACRKAESEAVPVESVSARSKQLVSAPRRKSDWSR